MSEGIPNKVSRAEADTRRREAMTCPENTVVYFETAHNIETNKETLRKPGTEVKWPILKPSLKRTRLCEKSATAGRESVNWHQVPHGGW